jgi:hypothetical protein
MDKIDVRCLFMVFNSIAFLPLICRFVFSFLQELESSHQVGDTHSVGLNQMNNLLYETVPKRKITFKL